MTIHTVCIHDCIESDDPWYSKSKKADESAKSKKRKELMDPLNDMKRFVSQTKKLSEAHPSGVSRVPSLGTTPGSSTAESASRHSVAEHSTERKERRKSDLDDGVLQKKHKSKSKYKKKEKEREKEAKLEEMRRQRRRREEKERTKAETMLRLRHSNERGRDGVGVSEEVEDATGRRYSIIIIKQPHSRNHPLYGLRDNNNYRVTFFAFRYNSQFNPHLVWQRHH